MRKLLMIATSAVIVVAALLVLFWYPGDEQLPVEISPLPTPAPSVQSEPENDAHLPDFPPPSLPEETPVASPPEEPFQPEADSFAPLDTPSPLDAQDEPTELLSEDDAVADTVSEPDIAGVTNVGIVFFDDLAEQIVAGYHPPKSEFNSGPTGRLRIHFSALNRRYGMELVGLRHESPSLIQGREEIFQNILRPEALETVWMLFLPAFEQALDRALQAATWSFPGQGTPPADRALTISEQQDFHRLLANAVAALAQVIQSYALGRNSIFLTDQWLQTQTNAYAAHSRYQQAEAELAAAQEETPADQVRILADRLERDAAAQGIMRAIAAREQARQNLLAIYQGARTGPELGEPELIYLSEWLWRRIHAHPDRAETFLLLADKLQELSLRLRRDTERGAGEPAAP